MVPVKWAKPDNPSAPEGADRVGRSGVFRTFLQTLGDLFWPPVCAVCSRLLPLADENRGAARHFCSQCYDAVEFLPEARCTVCGRPFYHTPEPQPGQCADEAAVTDCQSQPGRGHNGHLYSHVCGDCLGTPPPYRLARSALVYAGPVARSISLLKYYGDLTQVKVLADLARPGFEELLGLENYDAIIPLPVSKARRKERGFNQTEELAGELFASRKHLLTPHLLTRPETERSHQARLSASARRKAIKGSFAPNETGLVRGAQLLLFDDVYTTGAPCPRRPTVCLKPGRPEWMYLPLLARFWLNGAEN